MCGILLIIESMTFMWQIVYGVAKGGTGGLSLMLVAVVVVGRIPQLILMKM
jgi:hypothetical protein